MKSKLLLITGLLATAIATTFGQAAVPRATPEIFAYVTDGTNTMFPLKWDVYLPAAQGQYPAVLVIFGGRFSGGNRGDVAGIAADLAAQGFVALAIDYRTDKTPNSIGQQVPVYAPNCDPNQTANQPGDVKQAVSAARAGVIPSGHSIIYDWIIPGGKVGAVGGSSGASHALWCAATGSLLSDKLDAAVLFSGAYQFDDTASLTWQGLNGCDYPPNFPTFCHDVYKYCNLDPNSDCSASPPPQLACGSPIYQVHADVSPLFWISDPGDLITPYQFYDLKNLIASFNLGPPLFKSVSLTGMDFKCNHSFDNWSAEKDAVSNWLHARLDPSP